MEYSYCVICGFMRHGFNYPRCLCEHFMSHEASISYHPPEISIDCPSAFLPNNIRDLELEKICGKLFR